MPSIMEMQRELDVKRIELKRVMDEANQGGGDPNLARVKSIGGGRSAVEDWIDQTVSRMHNLKDEIQSAQRYDRANQEYKAFDQYLNQPTNRPYLPDGGNMAMKSVGRNFVESVAFKDYTGGTGHSSTLPVDFRAKALFGGGSWSVDGAGPRGYPNYGVYASGFEPETDRIGRVVLSAQRPPQLIDILPQYPTDQIVIKYMEETAFENAFAPTQSDIAQGEATPNSPSAGAPGTYNNQNRPDIAPEVSLGYTERTAPVEPIAGILPITTDAIADEPQVEALVNSRLMFMLDQKLDEQCTRGMNTPPHLRGLTSFDTVPRTMALTPGQSQMLLQERGTNTSMDSIYHAMTQVRTRGYANPTHIIMHPNDYLPIRLARGNDQYLLAGPTVGAQLGLWGLPIIENAALPEGTAFVGDFTMYSGLYYRQEAELQISDSHVDWFGRAILAIRGRLRAAFVIFRPTAFCKVTGLNA